MNPLEQELKKALQRREPPVDFTERLMARIQAAPDRRTVEAPAWRHWFRVPVLRWAAAAALCLAVVLGLVSYRSYEQRRRRDGEMARAKVILALRIASAKFNGAIREVKQVDQGPRQGTARKSGRRLERL